MTPDAYYYISVAYASIAALTSVGLVVKRFKKQFKHPGFIECPPRSSHPPYLIAAYWYWDGYEYMLENVYDDVSLVNGTNTTNHSDYFTLL